MDAWMVVLYELLLQDQIQHEHFLTLWSNSHKTAPALDIVYVSALGVFNCVDFGW